MVEEWRVSLRLTPFIEDSSYAGKRLCFPRAAVLAGLRSRFGEDTVISAESVHIFIYAETAGTAAEAEFVAREVLARLDASADVQREHWTPAAREWQDARGGQPDRAVAERFNARDYVPRQGRVLPVSVALVRSLVKAVTDGSFP